MWEILHDNITSRYELDKLEKEEIRNFRSTSLEKGYNVLFRAHSKEKRSISKRREDVV